MAIWNGKPISALDTSHIERILSAVKRGAWGDGRPCAVRLETARELRWELKRRGARSFKPDKPKVSDDVEQVEPPNYDAQLAAMGYVPPPAPIPAPWSKPWQPAPQQPSRFPSVAAESMEPKGAKLAAKLQAENEELTAQLLEATKASAYLERRAERLADTLARLKDEEEERALERKRKDREAQPMYRRLRGLERRAESADLEDITESELIAWWREELEDCNGALVDGIRRLLNVAGRGIDVQTIKPRKLRRPGIQKD